MLTEYGPSRQNSLKLMEKMLLREIFFKKKQFSNFAVFCFIQKELTCEAYRFSFQLLFFSEL